MRFLDQVVAEKQREIAAAKSVRPVADLFADAARQETRDFRAAVSRPGAVIAELKARTPTIASFRQSGSLHQLAAIYAENGAAAISIVADPTRFGTSLADVTVVRRAVPLPVLAKDSSSIRTRSSPPAPPARTRSCSWCACSTSNACARCSVSQASSA